MKYSIVIPCYNEEKNLPDLIDSLKSFPDKYDVQFILVENGSVDGSRNYMRSIEDQVMPKIQFVWEDQNQGYGYGIQQGLKVAEGDYAGWIHADMQMNPHDLTKFFDYLESYGKEEKLFLKGYRRNRKMVEYAFSYGMGVFETLMFRTKMCEVMSMPFIVPAEMINNLDQWPKDFAHDIYAYVKARRAGYRTIHIRVNMKDREKGESSWNTGFYSRIRQSIKIMKASFEIRRNWGGRK